MYIIICRTRIQTFFLYFTVICTSVVSPVVSRYYNLSYDAAKFRFVFLEINEVDCCRDFTTVFIAY